MSRVVVVETEVEDNDKNIIGEIATDLSPYTILSIGFKRPEAVLHGHKPGCRGEEKGGDLAEATRRAAEATRRGVRYGQ